MIKNLMSILILTMSLSHCSSTDILNVGGGVVFGWINGDKSPSPVSAIKWGIKKNKKDEKNENNKQQKVE